MRARDRLIDLAAAMLLGALALTPLATTFSGSLWVLVSLGAVLAGALCAGALAERQLWSWGIVPAVLLCYLLAAFPLTSRRSGWAALLPSSDHLGLILRGTVSVWGQLISTLPLVEGRGVPLLVPLALSLFPTALSAWLAVSTNLVVAPVIPPLGALVASFVLGRGDMAQWPAGVAFAAGALLWASRRGARLAGHATLTRARLLAMTSVAVIGGLVAGVVLSLSQPPPLVLRDQVARGMDTTTVPSLLTGFRRYSEPAPAAVDNVHDRRLITVSGADRGLRIRFACLDWYDGSQWRANPDSSPAASSSRYLRIGSTLDNPVKGQLVKVRVKVNRGWRSNWVPTAGALQGLGFDFRPRRPDRRDDLRYNVETQTALLPTWLKRGDNYWFAARIPDDSLTADMGVGPDLDPEVYERSAFLDETAQGFLAQHADPISALLAAAKQLRRKGRYSDGARGWEVRFTDGHDVERLGQLFLFAPQIVGNDEQYAAALALLATRMRIPARVVVGAVTPRSGAIRGRNVHAWVEIQVADGSWRLIKTKSFLGTKEPDRLKRERRKPDPLALVPKQRPRLDNPRDRRPPQSPRHAQQPPKQRADADGGRDWWWLLVALPLLIPTVKAVRRAGRRTRAEESARIAGAWEELTDAGRDLGVRVDRGETRPQQAAHLGADPDVADQADRHTFGPQLPTQDQADAFWHEVMAARRQLLSQRPRWQRLRLWFSLRSLLRRRSRDRR